MINRRLLRIKVLQVLYSHLKNTDKTIAAAENELSTSLDKTRQQYLLLLNLLRNFRVRAEIRADYLKVLPIFDSNEFSRLEKLAANPLFQMLCSNQKLSDAIEAARICWDENSEFTASLYRKAMSADYYDAFCNSQGDFAAGKRLAIKILEDIAGNEDFHAALEEHSIYWNDDLAFILPMAEKTLRKAKLEDIELFEALPTFAHPDDRIFVYRLLRKCISTMYKYDSAIQELSLGWKIERIADIELLMIRMAVVEAVEFPGIPLKVSLNEYIDMCKYYTAEKSKSFINGILNNIYRRYEAEGIIKKTGRGAIGPSLD
jgi:transcription antitermination protein NusB